MIKHNYTRARQVLNALVQGVDPKSGSELPTDGILNRVDVIRTLLASVSAIDQVTAREARRALLPEKVGRQWTPEEEGNLKMEFQADTSIPDIAAAHKRTVRAIEARLELLGLITAEQRTTNNSFTGAAKKPDG